MAVVADKERVVANTIAQIAAEGLVKQCNFVTPFDIGNESLVETE